MALQSSGAISLANIQTEFGGTNPISLSEYYSTGNAPASGEIQLAADFYGTSNTVDLDFTLQGGTTSRGAGTHSSVSIGTANTNRMVVISANSLGGNSVGIPSGITIGGNAMSIINSTNGLYIAFLKVPTGTTADIVITGGGTYTQQIYTLNTVNSSTSDSQINYSTAGTGAATSQSFTFSTTVSDDGVFIWEGFINPGPNPGGSFSNTITTDNSNGATTVNNVGGTSGTTRQGYSVCTSNDTKFARYTWSRSGTTKAAAYPRGAAFAFFKAN
jgi:hypothetical protein